VQLHDKYSKDGLQVVMMTQLYGSFKKDTAVAPAQELVHDREYFAGEHGMKFAIGIDTTYMTRSKWDSTRMERAAPKTAEAYGVAGIPHIVVIDKNGVVRQVYVGWLSPDERSYRDTNTERVDALVRKLLSEGSATGTR
jgi:hypothetical protein